MMLRDLILCSRGEIPADLVIRNVRIINVFSEEIFEGEIAVKDGFITRVGSCSDLIGEMTRIFDGEGMFAVPGFIDAHVHVESSLLCPSQFAKAVIPHGTSAIITDFHELANVLGVRGIKMIISEAKRLPMRIFIMAPSCVPAAPGVDTSGAEIGPKDIEELLREDLVIGLGEMMNFPGVINAEKDVLDKILSTERKRKVVDGHAPLLSGRNLQAYRTSGIITDHESTEIEEAIEKLRLGMYLLVRQGSVSKNIDILRGILEMGLPLERCIFVTDDKHVDDILENGHLEPVLRTAVEMGVDPIKAIKMVTLHVATAYRLSRMGAIAPGYYADIVLLEDLKNFGVKAVFLSGELVAKDGKLLISIEPYEYPKWALETINLKRRISSGDLTIRAKGDTVRIRVIGAKENSVITDEIIENMEVREGLIEADVERDILEIVVVERHKATGNIGLGFVRGFGLKRGAIGSSVAHDSHNIVAVGTNREDLARAINAIAEMGGGLVAVEEGKVVAKLELPLAGLMSLEEPNIVADKLRKLIEAARRMGARFENPFMTLSFMALPVIPKLKITDKGLFDVESFKHVPLIVK